MSEKRISINDIAARKGGTPLVVLTAYTAPFAAIMDKHTDILLVGDTVGMVLYGMDSTLPVTVDIMINHGRAVLKASRKSFVVVDMPFGSYQQSKEQAFANAARILTETGCNAVKLEGGVVMQETVQYLVERGIPVMGHVGLMPQSVNIYGGYASRGKDKAQRKQIIEDAVSIEKAGAFSVVVEGIKEDLAAEITAKLKIPVIGIGASAKCDGQVLVTEDMAGLFNDFTPKFVKKYGNLAEELEKSVKQYADEVRARQFPSEKYCY